MAKHKDTAHWLIRAFQSVGVDFDQLREAQPQATLKLLSKPEKLTSDDFNSLLIEGKNLARDDNLGLHLARYADITSLGIYGYLLLNATTLGELLELAERYYSIFYRAAKLIFQKGTSVSTLDYKPLFTSKLSARHDNEWTLGFYVLLICSRTEIDWTPSATYFTHSPPKDLTELHKVFGENLYFDQPYNRIAIDTDLLKLQINGADPQLLKIMQSNAESLIQSYAFEDSFESRVRLLIIKDIGTRQPNADSIARQVGMSISTFKRKLSKTNHNFRELKEDIIQQLAKKSLAETDSPISDIALMLGYSELSAFDHAFQRISGISPSEYRAISKSP